MQMTKKFPVLYIILIILILLIGTGFVFAHMSLQKQIEQSKSMLIQKQQEVTQLQAKIKELNELSETLNQLRTKQGSYEQLIPKKTDIPGLVRLLEYFAERSNINIEKITFKNEEETTGLSSIMKQTCELSIKGKYQSLLQFIQAIKTSPRLIGVRGVSVDVDQESTDIQFRLTAEFYYEGGTNQASSGNAR